jgi:hypothetical protein
MNRVPHQEVLASSAILIKCHRVQHVGFDEALQIPPGAVAKLRTLFEILEVRLTIFSTAMMVECDVLVAIKYHIAEEFALSAVDSVVITGANGVWVDVTAAHLTTVLVVVLPEAKAVKAKL